MNWVDTTIALSQVATWILCVWVVVKFYRAMNRKFDGLMRDVLEYERDKAYRQGVAHGWDTHERWSQNSANQWKLLQGRPNAKADQN